MARKKSKSTKRSLPSIQIASRETTHTIIGVVSAVLAVLFLLAAFGIGGRVGNTAYQFFSFLFGIGYYLIPLVFAVLAVSFFQLREREFATPQMVGSILLFASLLGFVSSIFEAKGGVVGGYISTPLIMLFDLYATIIVLLAIALISTLVIFDTPLRVELSTIANLFRKKETEELNETESETIARAEQEAVAKSTPEPTLAKTDQNAKKSRTDESDFMPALTGKSGKVWSPPPLSLLEKDRGKATVGDIKANANLIKRTLLNFGIAVEMDEISIGPSVTRYALKPAEGVKLSKILGLQNNLELALASHPVRIEAPIPGKSLVGIEVPNTQKSTIGLGSLLSEDAYAESGLPLLAGLGKDITGKSHFSNISKMPHLLIAGATGSGKSVTIHAIINSLLFRNPPENLKLIMIDPKRVELTLYNGIPHLLTPVITDPKKSILALKWTIKEMERRYEILQESKVRDIDSYHRNILLPALKKKSKGEDDPYSMPYIVVVIDELADLMQSYPRELEASIVRLAQMSRAVGIHLILSTQRPSVNVITGLIKANIPARVALQVSSQIDSRTILDASGAEKLLGAGDMLYLSGEMSKPVRIQSAFISESEVKEVVKYLKDAYADELEDQINLTQENTSNSIFSADLDGDNPADEDDLYEEAREVIIEAGKGSTSYLQRKLRIGYARAARLMDILENEGVIGPQDGSKPREVLEGQSESDKYESEVADGELLPNIEDKPND